MIEKLKSQDLTPRSKTLFKAIRSAGALLVRHYGKTGVAQAYSKEGYAANLASKADTQSQEVIIATIKKSFPQDHFLAEEGELETDPDSPARTDTFSGTVPARGLSLSLEKVSVPTDFLWVIDPLDGTVNFLHSYPLFAVSIAFVFKGEPVLGAILDPIRNELFWAQRGKGAYLRKGDESDKGEKGDDRRVHVSETRKLKNSLLVTGFAYDRQERADFYLSYYKVFLKIAHDVRRTGSAALDLAWLAAGRHDGFWEWGLNPWDVAAGALIVQEAGGQITHFDGKPYNIFETEQTLATNGRIHGECLDLF